MQSSSTLLSTAAVRGWRLFRKTCPSSAHCILRYAFAGRPGKSETSCNIAFVIVALLSLCLNACYRQELTEVTVCALQHWHSSRDKYLGRNSRQHAALSLQMCNADGIAAQIAA
ncbi:TPA: hypothetical protein ACH3X2_009536 [Trebouxia sp. C0005]